MANKPLQIRLSPITHAYLADLVDIGYGKDETAIARHWIENEVARVVETKVISTRRVQDAPAPSPRKEKEP
jgi:hypothetical protein